MGRLLFLVVLAVVTPLHAQEPAASPPAQAPATPGVAERVAADTPATTPAGHTFTVPSGWAMRTTGQLVIVAPPEPDMRVAILDVQANDAETALAAAWKEFDARFERPIRLRLPQPARSGWEERHLYVYETSPNERAVVQALALRAGTRDAWTAVLIDASQSTSEKRGGPFSLLLQSLRPKGYVRESFAGRKAHPLDEKRLEMLKDFVAKGMELLEVPGVGLAFIDGGKTVWAGGLGVKELGKPDPVTADTLFIAASNTKALTTLLLAQLVDEKRIRWDQPVREVFPGFALGEADTTKQVLVKHLVCACTGMPRRDREWLFEYEDHTPADTMTMLGRMRPTSRFGEVFQYSNLMAAAAGYVGAAILFPGRELGAAYDEAMRTRIFGPLGMTTTTFDFARALKGDVAQPHGNDVDGHQRVARMDLNYSVVPVRPAGGVWTSARELSRYVEMELAKGLLPDGRRLVSEANLLARRAPQVLVSEDVAYGMGLFVDTRLGIPVVNHGGDLAGYHSDMIWLPDHGIGAVILTNADSGVQLRNAFQRRLLEVVFDGKPEAEERLRVTAAARKAAFAKERERLSVPADATAAAALAGRYMNEQLGELIVRREGDQVVFDVTGWRSTVASRKNEDGTISFLTIDPTLLGFEFVVADKDGVRRLVTRDAQHEYVFVESATTANE